MSGSACTAFVFVPRILKLALLFWYHKMSSPFQENSKVQDLQFLEYYFDFYDLLKGHSFFCTQENH
jgi:hypothetical protein